MIWNRLKKTSEALLASSLQGRVEYHLTRYGRGVSELMTRGWITLDGREIISCSTIKQVRESHNITGLWYSRDTNTRDELHRQGIFTRQEYLAAITECVDNPINVVLQSTNPLARAIALLDRRLGMRKLRQMIFRER